MRGIGSLILILILFWIPAAHSQSLLSIGDKGEESSKSEESSPNVVEVDAGPLMAAFGEWQTVLDDVRLKIDQMEKAPRNDPQILQAMAKTIQDVLDRADEVRAEAEAGIDRPKAALEALGGPPEDGEPPEASVVAEKRDELEVERASLNARIRLVQLVHADAEILVQRLALLSEKSFMNWVFERQLLSSATLAWPDAGQIRTFGDTRRRVGTIAPDIVPFGIQIAVSLLLALAAAGAMAALNPRTASARAERSEDEEPDRRDLAVSAAVLAASRSVLPAIICLSLAWFSVLVLPDAAYAVPVAALLVGLAAYLLFYRISRISLAPSRPEWRLVDLDDASATALHGAIRVLAASAACFIAAYLAIRYAGRLPEDLLFILKWAVCLAMAAGVVFLFVCRGASGRALTGSDRWDRIIGAGVGLITLLAIAAAGAGYLNLSFFALTHMAGTLLLAAGAFLVRPILHNALRAAFSSNEEEFERDEQGIFEVMIHFGLDLLVVVLIGIAVLGFWGLPVNVIWLWLAQLSSGIRIGQLSVDFADIVFAVIVFTVVLTLFRFLHNMFRRRVLERMSIELGLRDSIDVGLKYIGFTLALLAAIATLGVNLETVALLFGALLLGVGFGLQNLVDNFVSGIVLLVQRPIKSGDWIIVDGHEGFVKRIGVISTEISTFVEASVIIPNGELISSAVVNRTHGLSRGRVDIPVGVAYGSDISIVRKILKGCAEADETVLDSPEPDVELTHFNESSVDFELRVYIADIRNRYSVGTDLRIAILREFAENGIEIPYPQQDLHVRTIEQDIGLSKRAGQENQPDAPEDEAHPDGETKSASTGRKTLATKQAADDAGEDKQSGGSAKAAAST